LGVILVVAVHDHRPWDRLYSLVGRWQSLDRGMLHPPLDGLLHGVLGVDEAQADLFLEDENAPSPR
jgi:hypothetical protein